MAPVFTTAKSKVRKKNGNSQNNRVAPTESKPGASIASQSSEQGFNNLAKFEDDLWEAADNLRANSKLTSSDYFMPVLGVIFLRHAANRFDAAHRQIVADQASGKMPKRPVLPADYIARRSLYLPETARYDQIMQQASVGGADLPKLVTNAMAAIEAESEPIL